MEPFLGKGHHLLSCCYMDYFYNNVNFPAKLISKVIPTIGKLRGDTTDNPVEVVKKTLKLGKHVWLCKGKVYVSKWHKRCFVYNNRKSSKTF